MPGLIGGPGIVAYYTGRMANTFKVGDRVKRIAGGDYYLKVGEIYTIARASAAGLDIQVEEIPDTWWMAMNFELAEPLAEPRYGDLDLLPSEWLPGDRWGIYVIEEVGPEFRGQIMIKLKSRYAPISISTIKRTIHRPDPNPTVTITMSKGVVESVLTRYGDWHGGDMEKVIAALKEATDELD